MGRPRAGRRGPLVLAALLFLGACAPQPPDVGPGSLDGTSYAHPYFGLTLSVPEGWEAKRSPDHGDRFLDAYLRLLAVREGSDPSRRARILLQASTLPAPLMGASDAVVALGAAYVADKPGLDQSRAVALARALIEKSPVPMRITRDFRGETLGGAPFVGVELEVRLEKETIREALHVGLRGGHALVISVVARGPKGLPRAEELLRTIRFSGPET